jgi:molybdate transport system substrate-binding protein
MTWLQRLVSVAVLASACTAAMAKDLVVLCAGAVKPVLSALEPTWSARSGQHLQVTYAPAGELLARLAAGEQADIVIMPLENLASIEKQGRTTASSRRDLGAVGIGVAVKQGAALPDLSSESGLKRALLDARSVTFMDPTRGTSGRHFDEVVLPKLGIRDEVRAKAVLGEGGMIGEKVARGEVEIAFQQMTELLPVAGIRIAGVLPPSLQKTTVYSGAVTTVSSSSAEAAELLAFLVSAEARSVFTAKGFATP